LIAQRLKKITGDLVTKISLDIVDGLVRRNPVDTGWSRANWIPSIGSPVENPVGDRQAVNTGPQQAGIAQLSQFRLGDGAVYITNNVPYIDVLNLRGTASAPAGWVQREIDAAIKKSEGDILI
jgi:hypothetical protein